MAECTPMTPKAPERPRMAAAAVARIPRSRRLGTAEAPLAGPLPDDDRLVAGEHVAGEALLVGGYLGADLEADRGDGLHVRAVGLQLADGAVLDAQGLGQHAHGLVEQQRAVGGAQRQAGQARHGRLAVGALALGGRAPRLGLGALALGDDAARGRSGRARG